MKKVIIAIYCVVLVALGLLRFQPGGFNIVTLYDKLLFPTGIILEWLAVSWCIRRFRARKFLLLIPFACMVYTFCALLGPTLTGHQLSGSSESKYQLERICNAIKDYQKTFNGQLPPAVIVDEDGLALHSWRVVILPFLNCPEADDFFNAYDFSQPWDSEYNLFVFSLVNHHSIGYANQYSFAEDDKPWTKTVYKIITGEGTNYPNADGKPITAPDGRTGIILEDVRNPVMWTKPDYLSIDDAVNFLSTSTIDEMATCRNDSVFGELVFGAHVATPNGELIQIQSGNDAESIRRLLTVNSTPKNIEHFGKLFLPHLRSYFSFIGLMAMLLLPFPFVLFSIAKARTFQSGQADNNASEPNLNP